MTGRPRIIEYDTLSKICESCGREYFLREHKFQSRARFMRRRFCSITCHVGCTPGMTPEHFWTKIEKREADACWPWLGRLMHKGYGVVDYQGNRWRAHRLAFTLAKGEIPDGLMVLHSCDNRRCCNPAHLRVGTNKENVQDAIARGRWTQARPIRHLVARDPRAFQGSISEAARTLGVSWMTIKRIRTDQPGGAGLA